jgi:zinc transporter ZupT
MEFILSFVFTLLIVLVFNYVINRVLELKHDKSSRQKVLLILVIQSAIIAVLLTLVL